MAHMPLILRILFRGKPYSKQIKRTKCYSLACCCCTIYIWIHFCQQYTLRIGIQPAFLGPKNPECLRFARGHKTFIETQQSTGKASCHAFLEKIQVLSYSKKLIWWAKVFWLIQVVQCDRMVVRDSKGKMNERKLAMTIVTDL